MHEASVVVDREGYRDAVTPWEDEGWRRAAVDWARRQLSTRGTPVSGPLRVRLRPWSVLVRIPVAPAGGCGGAAWFKANPPASAFEAGLGQALAAWVPRHVLRPIAVDAARGWSLLPEGGTLWRTVLDGGPADARAWEEPLRQYASMQRALLPHVRRLRELGVPDARAAALPGLYDRLVDGAEGVTDEERAELRALRPRLADWCRELAATGVPDSLDHSDLHEGQILVPRPGRFTFFDWGDATVAHPFTSLLVTSRMAARRFGAEVLPRLRDAYLEPWTGEGLGGAELRRAAGLACRLGAVGRACAWGRLFPGPQGAAGAEAAAARVRWLRRLFDESSPHR
ncbi:aminoglycoside phosphotransferase family protein [Streptomyces sp. MS06]|uniref:aminoglycoside phosphotransferase family protein n=1 Tax=Streptomyces sp. MS06 TaxID=3385974 RepID=UPI0039A0CA2B